MRIARAQTVGTSAFGSLSRAQVEGPSSLEPQRVAPSLRHKPWLLVDSTHVEVVHRKSLLGERMAVSTNGCSVGTARERVLASGSFFKSLYNLGFASAGG